MASYIQYITNQIDCHDPIIDDRERDLKDLMGTIEIIKDEVLKMSKMYQYSHCQDSPEEGALPMEEATNSWSQRQEDVEFSFLFNL